MDTLILTIGDPHIRNDQLLLSKKMIKAVLNAAKDINPDIIVIMGDILHSHDVIKLSPLSIAHKFIDDLSKIAPVILLIGNHDIANNQVYLPEQSIPEHPFVGLKEWPNVTVCDQATLFEINDMTFCAVPYVPPGRYMETIKDINIPSITAFFSHQEFRGVKARLIDTEGSCITESWPNNYPLNICGHFHEAQIISKNLIYVGTPHQQTFAESDNKALGLFTFSPKKDYKYDRIPLKGTIKRRQYDILACDVAMFPVIYSFVSSNEDHLVKVVISGTSNEIETLHKNRLVKNLKKHKRVNLVFYIGREVSILNSEIVMTRMSFRDFLNEKLYHDGDAHQCFLNLFS